jgi:hypothetical protein
LRAYTCPVYLLKGVHIHNPVLLLPLRPGVRAAGAHFDPGQMFSTAHADAINVLQLLMRALTQLQRAAQHEEITAALQVSMPAQPGLPPACSNVEQHGAIVKSARRSSRCTACEWLLSCRRGVMQWRVYVPPALPYFCAPPAAFVALQYESSNGNSSSSIAGPEPPLLWVAEELVAPLGRQLLEVFGPNVQGSPGDINSPALVLAVVHRLAQDNAPRVDFLQVGRLETVHCSGSSLVWSPRGTQWDPLSGAG